MLNRWLLACLGGWLSAFGGIGAASHSGVEVCQWSCGGAPSVPSGSNVSQIPKGSSAPVSDSDPLRRWPCQLAEVSWHSVSPVGIGFGTLSGLATGSHPVQICWPKSPICFAQRLDNFIISFPEPSAEEAAAKMFKSKPVPANLATPKAKEAAERKLNLAADRLENRPEEPPLDGILFDPDAPEPDMKLRD